MLYILMLWVESSYDNFSQNQATLGHPVIRSSSFVSSFLYILWLERLKVGNRFMY